MSYSKFALNILVLFAFTAFDVDAEIVKSRARRFCCGGVQSLEGFGGKVGCVVSQNKLFINGIFTKDLNSDEQQESEDYKKARQQFKDNLSNYVEQLNNAPGEEGEELAPKLNRTEPPKKPSFCNEKAITQFVFDGCMVQGDNVYIGQNFVRKLSAEEQKELEEFDEKFTVYQKAMSKAVHRQISQAFDKTFGRMFGPGPFGKHQQQIGGEEEEGEGGEGAETTQGNLPAERKPFSSSAGLPELPKAPEFCTVIV